jgi:hypothetical protein
MEPTTCPVPQGADTDDHEYPRFLLVLRERFTRSTATNAPLFTTSAEGLSSLFLEGLPPEARPTYNCMSCFRFLDKYGGLATLNEDAQIEPLFWEPTYAPHFFREAVHLLRMRVLGAKVTGVFLAEEAAWGLPKNRDPKRQKDWFHMAVEPPKALRFKRTPLKNADQRMAELREDYGILQRSLLDFSADSVRTAYTALTTGRLYRAEKAEGVAKWLLDLTEQIGLLQGRRRENFLWRAVATAPTGYCHVRSSMIGTLLADLQGGMDFDEVARRWGEKMNPLQYRRPQAPPTAGNIARAEKVVAELQSAGALARRFARLEDLQTVWTPPAPRRPVPGKESGIFAHLKTEPVKPTVKMPAVTMTWVKFEREVLPTADRLEVFVPSGRVSLVSLVTAVNPEAPPILQWDSAERRNPVSWFFHLGGGVAWDWGLQSERYYPVSAIVHQPSMRHGGFQHHGKAVYVLVEGAQDRRHRFGGGLFTEMLRSEYHEVRSTLEAYLNTARVEGADQGSATGFCIKAGATAPANPIRVRVTTPGAQLEYSLDRWD